MGKHRPGKRTHDESTCHFCLRRKLRTARDVQEALTGAPSKATLSDAAREYQKIWSNG